MFIFMGIFPQLFWSIYSYQTQGYVSLRFRFIMLSYIPVPNMKVFESCFKRIQDAFQRQLLKLIVKLDKLNVDNTYHRDLNMSQVTHVVNSRVLVFVNDILSGCCPVAPFTNMD